jgi:hypothetical protein
MTSGCGLVRIDRGDVLLWSHGPHPILGHRRSAIRLSEAIPKMVLAHFGTGTPAQGAVFGRQPGAKNRVFRGANSQASTCFGIERGLLSNGNRDGVQVTALTTSNGGTRVLGHERLRTALHAWPLGAPGRIRAFDERLMVSRGVR